MEKPALIIMAAGMGSRYGSLKHIYPVDTQGHILNDYSVYDALKSGFEKVVFLIKRETEDIFRDTIGRRIEPFCETEYVFQELDLLPAGFSVPEGRKKPWGTAHAILCCKDAVKGPFAVINADDYYGPNGFSLIYDYLQNHRDDEVYRYAMVGYQVENTLTENGSVSRGICQIGKEGCLLGIQERTNLCMTEKGPAYSEDKGNTWVPVPEGTTVSMNLWGFQNSIFREIEAGFPAFLEKGLKENPEKCEYYIPSVVEQLIREGKASVQVLKSGDRWHGVTYKEDKPKLIEALARKKEEGQYPEYLWKEPYDKTGVFGRA